MNNYGRYENKSGRNPRRTDNTRYTVQPMSNQRRQGTTGRSQRQNSAMHNRDASRENFRVVGNRGRSSTHSGSSSRQEVAYRGGSMNAGGRAVEDERARMRARARKKKRRLQRRILLGSFFLLLLFLIGGAAYGFVRHQRETKKQELLKEGIELLNGNHYEEAITRLDEALQWSKGKVGEFEITVLLYRAEAEFRLEDYDAALNTYGILRKEDSENEDYKRGEAYCKVKKGDYDGALALGVIDGYVCNLKAVEQINAGEYDGALEWIERGKAAGDSLQDLLFNEAVAWENKGEFTKALELFEAYAKEYGTDENVEHELTFLRSRQKIETTVQVEKESREGEAENDSGEEGSTEVGELESESTAESEIEAVG